MKKSIKIAVLLAGMGVLANPTIAQKLKQDSRLVKGTLKNGFSYYIYPNDQKDKQSHIQLFLKAGSLQEKDSQQGLAHFVEHMAFNGSKNYPKNEIITFLESLGVKFGADLNAHTSYDETVYKVTLNTEDEQKLEKALDIFADWATELSFDSEEIEKERGVIIEEWRSRQNSSSRLSDQYLPLIFKDSRYAVRKPIGKVDILKSFERQTIVDFYKDWYRPNLMALAIVTNQNPKLVEKYIKQQFSEAKNSKNAPIREIYSIPERRDTLYSIVTDKEATSVDFSYLSTINPMHTIATEQDYVMYLNRLFYNNLAKQRFERISQLDPTFKKGSVSIGNLLLNNGVTSGGASLYESNIEEGIQDFMSEKQRIINYGFTKTEIDELKKEYLASYERSAKNETKTNPQMMLGEMKNLFMHKTVIVSKAEEFRLLKKYIGGIDSVSVLGFGKQFYKEGNTTVMLTAPTSIKDKLPTQEQLAKWDYLAKTNQNLEKWVDNEYVPTQLLSKLPAAGSILKIDSIAEVGVEKWELSNGTTIYLKQNNDRKNHISLTGYRKGGISTLDSSKYVNAVFSKNLVGASGAGDFSRRALSKYLKGNTASAIFVFANNREGVAASSDIKDVETMFQLLHLKWTQPRVDETVFNNTKKRTLDNLKSAKNSPMVEYNKRIAKLLKSDEDYAPDLSAEKIEKELKFEEVLDTYNSRFASAKDFTFVLVGDFDKEQIKPYILQYVAGLPAGAYVGEGKTEEVKTNDNSGDFTMFAGESEKAQVNIFYQTNNINYNYPEIIEYEVLQEVLKVKLRKNLREENSGVYGVGVSVGATSIPSPLVRTRIVFTCAPERKDFLIDQVDYELNKIANDPAYFVEELASIKKQLLVNYNKQYPKQTFWSGQLRNQLYFGIKDWNYFVKYEEMLNNITPNQISKLIKDKLLAANKIQGVLMPTAASDKK